MNKDNREETLKYYFYIIEDKVKTLYEKESDDELKNLIDLIKFEDDNNFHKSFINQIYYLIKIDKDKIFFVLNQKKI